MGEGARFQATREQREDPFATEPSDDDELSQTNRGVRGVCMGIVLRVQSKLSRVLHGHPGKNLLQDLRKLDTKTMNRVMVRFRGAGEGCHGIFGIPEGLARRHDGGPPLEGDLRQEPRIT